MLSNWPEWIIGAILALIESFRLTLRKRKSSRWPQVEGAVQPCSVLPGDASLLSSPFKYRSIFGYAFPANGSRYAGFFALEAENEATAIEWQKGLPGTAVTIRYDPRNPDVSVLANVEILGRRVIQNPHWLP